MSFHSIPEPRKTAASAEVPAVTLAIPASAEIDPDALALLREFFLLLEEWERREEQL